MTTTTEPIVEKPRFKFEEPRIEFDRAKWADLPAEIQDDLVWFFTHARSEKWNQGQCAEAINYDSATISRLLSGTYQGSFENVSEAIQGFRKLVKNRVKIQDADFRANRNTALIHNAFGYALASNSITLIVGETGTSKTSSAENWLADKKNIRRGFLISPSEISPSEGLIKDLAEQLEIPTKNSLFGLRDQIHQKINSNHLVIVDEPGFLLPEDKKDIPIGIEFLRRLHDKRRCAIALLATARFNTDLEKLEWQFEQLLGRIGLIVRLFKQFEESEVLNIVEQYIPNPSKMVIKHCMAIANPDAKSHCKGHLRTLVERLRLASRIAAEEHTRVTEATFLKALNTYDAMRNALQAQPK